MNEQKVERKKGGGTKTGGFGKWSNHPYMYIHVYYTQPHLVNTAAPFSPRCRRAGCWSRRASRKFC